MKILDDNPIIAIITIAINTYVYIWGYFFEKVIYICIFPEW